MRRVIFNQKGGVGKSTITCNLAAISAMQGKRTLVIDLDVQGNSTQYLLGHKVTDSEKTIAVFFKDCLSLSLFGSNNGSGIDSVIHETPFPNLFVLPSHPDLEPLQGRLESRFKIFKLKEAIDKLEGFASFFGADFYRLPRNIGTVTLEKSAWTIPSNYGEHENIITPLKADEDLYWKIQS